jgi:predicted RNA-binding Zn-ribbon protein involved in translation (DUF1610 family)
MALAHATIALARVGGGQSYSGGSHSSSFGGGGSGGGGDLVFLLIELVIDYPAVGLPVTAVVIGFFMVSRLRAGTPTGWSASGDIGPSAVDDGAPSMAAPGARLELLGIRELDPQFSLVLFEDFLYALYEEVQTARAGGKLQSLSPYLAPEVITGMARDQGKPDKVEGVIVAGLHFISVSGLGDGAPMLSVRVRFGTNYTEITAGASKTYYAVEIWTLIRSRAARSRPPEKTRVFKCPNCGAPLEAVVAGKCSYCGKQVATGELDWLVQVVGVMVREARAPTLFSDGSAPRDVLPTRTTDGAAERFNALQTRDSNVTFEAFQARVEMIFVELQAAWSNLDWSRARPFTSDRLFQDWAHWMELYRQERARNVIERPRIARVELCDVESDLFYDAITARLHASCVDYTVSDDGKLLGGNKSAEKPFSEYWTLIRGAGVKGAPSVQKLCPQCGAELKINMAGRCDYCQAEVTSGKFDWVLSRIEQDDAYDG